MEAKLKKAAKPKPFRKVKKPDRVCGKTHTHMDIVKAEGAAEGDAEGATDGASSSSSSSSSVSSSSSSSSSFDPRGSSPAPPPIVLSGVSPVVSKDMLATGGKRGLSGLSTVARGNARLSFAAARAITRKLGLQSSNEWKDWAKSGKRPYNIPGCPDQSYRDNGWIDFSDWLGYVKKEPGSQRRGTTRMMPFLEARAIVRKLKLGSYKQWYVWSKSGQRPFNIPGNPLGAYKDDGFISMPDFLGYVGRPLPGNMLPFEAARAIVRKEKLRSKKEWHAWRKTAQRPSNVPAAPAVRYRDEGWISIPDWLGYDKNRKRAKKVSHMLPFTEARAIVRNEKLRSKDEWQAWSKSGKRPFNVPGCPWTIYRDTGWVSYPDWLGYKWKPPPSKMLPFAEARAVVHRLKVSGGVGVWVWGCVGTCGTFVRVEHHMWG